MAPDAPQPSSSPRVHALAETPRTRFGAFRGQVLDEAPDEVLDAIVAEVAAATGAPTAAITLLLEHTQRFRASVGLPDDLAQAGGTDSSASLCQFVVRDHAPFFVEDALTRPDIPTALLGHGVRRYLGVPVRVDDDVVGALCVISDVPGPLRPGELAELLSSAEQVSARLQHLAGPTPATLTRGRSWPVFGELRNALVGVLGAGAALRLIEADLAPVRRALQSKAFTALPLLEDAAAALGELSPLASDLDAGTSRIRDGVILLERTLTNDDRRVPLASALEQGLGLAEHTTKIHGGARLRPSARPPGVIVSSATARVLAAALVELAPRVEDDAGIVVDAYVAAGQVHLVLVSSVGPAAVQECRAALRPFEGDLHVGVTAGHLVLSAAAVGFVDGAAPEAVTDVAADARTGSRALFPASTRGATCLAP